MTHRQCIYCRPQSKIQNSCALYHVGLETNGVSGIPWISQVRCRKSWSLWMSHAIANLPAIACKQVSDPVQFGLQIMSRIKCGCLPPFPVAASTTFPLPVRQQWSTLTSQLALQFGLCGTYSTDCWESSVTLNPEPLNMLGDIPITLRAEPDLRRHVHPGFPWLNFYSSSVVAFLSKVAP